MVVKEREQTQNSNRPKRKTFMPVMQAYLDEVVSKGGRRTGITFSFSLLSRYIEETGLPWDRWSTKDAQGFQTVLMALTDEQGERVYAPSTVVGAVTALTGFYAWAKRKRLVHTNPFTHTKRVKQPKKLPKDIYEPEELEQLLTWLSRFNDAPTLKERRERYLAHVVAELMYATGFLVGELKTLRPADVDLTRRTATVYIPQFKKTRTAFLTEYAADVLKVFIEDVRDVYLISPNYRTSRHLLFGTSAELTKTVNTVLLKGAAELGLAPCTTRMFRHALNLHLVKAGCDARFVQELAGHLSLSTTQLYVRLDKRDLRGILDTYHPRGCVSGLDQTAKAPRAMVSQR